MMKMIRIIVIVITSTIVIHRCDSFVIQSLSLKPVIVRSRYQTTKEQTLLLNKIDDDLERSSRQNKIVPSIISTRQSHQKKYGILQSALHETTKSINDETSLTPSLKSICDNLNTNWLKTKDMIAKVCKVEVAPIEDDDESDDDNNKKNSMLNKRLGFKAIQSISKGDVCLEIPYNDQYEIRADICKNIVFKQYLTDEYNNWTGDIGYIALMILNEVARYSVSSSSYGIPLPERPQIIQEFMKSWIESLPSPNDMLYHPIFWNEHDQEILQSSSTKKIYKVMDDIEDDYIWLSENIFNKDRTNKFPEMILWNNQMIPCFHIDGYKWAITIASSRSYYLDNKLRCIPYLDMCNHSDDDNNDEIQGDNKIGLLRITKGIQLIASQNYKIGQEVTCSYGPKSAIEYLLDYGFVSSLSLIKNPSCELTFEIDINNDRFYDDKIDILEYETTTKLMDPIQLYDIYGNNNGEPDISMIQFLRLCKLDKTDAFLLESIFRKEVWDFMSLPVSELNELDVYNEIINTCQNIINDDFNNNAITTMTTTTTTTKSTTKNNVNTEESSSSPSVSSVSSSISNDNNNYNEILCQQIRDMETSVLQRTISYIEREKQAIDLKEYYQQRRLRDLGLDSQWAPEDKDDVIDYDIDDDEISFGQKRKPGSGDW